MSKKYQVFISSTYQDLIEEREQVIKAILEMGHIPVGMEMFSAADEEQWKIITRQIDESDYYTIITAHRYGSVTSDGTSYTEKEFDYAASIGVPVLGFVIDDSAPWPKNKHESEPEPQKKLSEFKTKIKKKLINNWKSKEDLHGKFSISLMKAITANPRTGWVKANEVNGPEVTAELTRLSSENSTLRNEIQKLRKSQDTQTDEIRKIILILSKNERKLRIRKTSEWKSVVTHKRTFADIFLYIAPNLISEDSCVGISENIALHTLRNNYYKPWPIGANVVSDILADLAALDIIEPSKKKHSVSDKEEYWTLTPTGKKVLNSFRRVRLEEGLTSEIELFDEAP